MNNQEQQEERQVKLDKWPVSFREWTDAYIIQILGDELKNYTQRRKKDVREGLIDKLKRRMELLFDLPLVYKNENLNFLRLFLSDELDLYLEEDELLNLLIKWSGDEKNNIEILKDILSDAVDLYLEEEEINNLLEKWKDDEVKILRLVLSDVVDLCLEEEELSEYIIEWSNSKENSIKIVKLILSDVIDRCLSEEKIQELFEKWTEWGKEQTRTSNYILPEESIFFLQDEKNQKIFEEWQERELQEVIAKFQSKYDIAQNHSERLMEILSKEANREEYEILDKKYSKKEKELNDIKEKGKEKIRQMKRLDVIDFLKIPLFDNVSQCESDFYCFLLRNPFLDKNIIADLKGDKWWVIDIETRVRLLRNIELLMSEEKWGFIENDFYLIAMKLLRPHEYILTKESVVLLRKVCESYSVGNSRIYKFCEEKNSETDQDMDYLEIEYSDVLDSEMSESDDEEKTGMTKGEKILELANAMKALSRDLNIFIEKNEMCPDLKKEMEEIEKIYCKEKENHKG